MPDRTIRIPLWRSIELLFGIPIPILLVLGTMQILDSAFHVNLIEEDLGLPGVILGILFLVLSVFYLHRILAYPGITFTRNAVVVPP